MLPPLLPQGDAGPVSEVAARLSHADWRVRLTALKALAAIAAPGDAGIIAAVAARLEDPYFDVRLSAGRALAQVPSFSFCLFLFVSACFCLFGLVSSLS